MQYCCGYFNLEYLYRYSDVTVTEATVHPVAAEYPHSTLKGTPSCSSQSGTALYETHEAGQEESGCASKQQAYTLKSIVRWC